MIKFITQSFMKDMDSYLQGDECGHIIKHKYVDEKELPGSDAMLEGCYFEYLISTALPKNKKVPEPIFMASAKGTEVKDMEQGYRRAHFNSEYIKGLLYQMGLEIVGFGKKLTNGRHQGTIDLILKVKNGFTFNGHAAGYKFVTDLKYSGLVDDKWSKFGWMFTPDQKTYHKVQAIEYHFITGLDFYFLVCQSNNKELDKNKNLFVKPEVKFFQVNISEEAIEQHLIESNTLWEHFLVDVDLGFRANGSLTKCGKCPLFDKCNDKVLTPFVEIVNV